MSRPPRPPFEFAGSFIPAGRAAVVELPIPQLVTGARISLPVRIYHGRGEGPVVASTDYMGLFAEQIRKHVPGNFRVLGTDGYGRSDFRRKLRHHFEVDRHFVAVAALKALADENKLPSIKVAEAIEKYDIDPQKPNPARV